MGNSKKEGEIVHRGWYAYYEYVTPYGVVVAWGSSYMVYSNAIPLSIRRRDFEYRLENGLLNGREIGYGKDNERKEG